ncbi:retrovirus-related pol polyprotein from transposon TNT 1-94 [Tanacetum coccineum]
MGQSTQTMHMLTKPQVFYDKSHKTALYYQNPFYLAQARRKVPTLYDGHTIVKKHDALSVTDTKETLKLAEESRLKMLAKQNDETVKEKKVNISPVDYVSLNKLSEHFVPQKQLSAKQTFWLPILHPVSEKQQVPSGPVFKKGIPHELPSISLHKELNEMKEVFQQMETEVTKCQVDRKCFEIEKKELILERERLLEHIICQDVMNVVMHVDVNNLLISQDIVHTHVNTLAAINDYNTMKKSYIDEYSKNLVLKCISLEIKLQQSKESFHKNRPSLNQKAPDIQEFFNINEWQAKLDTKDLSIAKLREHIVNLKGKNVVDSAHNLQNSNVVTSRVYKLDLPPLSSRVKNNREAHVDYLKHSQEHAKILREIVEHARELRPLDSDLDYACKYIIRVQELLVYVSATCPSSQHESQKLVVVTPMNKTRKVRFTESKSTSKDKSQKHANTQNKQTPNNVMLPSIGIKSSTEASGSKPKSNARNDRISQPSCSNKNTNKVEAQPRIVKPCLKTKNRVSKSILNANVQHTMLNANSHLVCSSCNECLFDAIHDSYISDYIFNMHARSKSVKSKKKKIWKCTRKIFNTVGYRWIPTGRTFTINGNKCPLTRITPDSKVPLKKPVTTTVVVQIILWYLDSGCSKHMTGQRSQLINFVSKFLGTVRFGNDQIAKIMGYGDYQLGNVTISCVYYVEGLGHNLDTNLYTISLDDMLNTSPICLLSKASKTKIWLWHRRLSHLNFGTLNQLAKDGLARGFPKLKYQKDHLCLACALGKSKKSSHTPKAEYANLEKLNLLHMGLCGPMHVESINEKKYILVIVDDYS